MLNDIEDRVLQLHDCLGVAIQNGEFARSVVSDIVHICGEIMNDQTIGKSITDFKFLIWFLNTQILYLAFCLSIFFKREKSLLTFLKKALARDEVNLSFSL